MYIIIFTHTVSSWFIYATFALLVYLEDFEKLWDIWRERETSDALLATDAVGERLPLETCFFWIVIKMVVPVGRLVIWIMKTVHSLCVNGLFIVFITPILSSGSVCIHISYSWVVTSIEMFQRALLIPIFENVFILSKHAREFPLESTASVSMEIDIWFLVMASEHLCLMTWLTFGLGSQTRV